MAKTLEQTTEQVVHNLITKYKDDIVALDAIYQWAMNPTSMSAGYGIKENYEFISENLRLKYNLDENLIQQTIAEIKSQIDVILNKENDVYKIQNLIFEEIDEQKLKLDAIKRLKSAPTNVINFIYMLTKMSEIPTRLTSYNLEELNARYNVMFSDSFPNIKQLIVFGICNSLYYRSAKGEISSHRDIPQYTISIIGDMGKHLELPKITLPDVQKYITFLFENKNTEGLYSLYWIIKHGGYYNANLPEYLKFVPQNGIIAIDRKHAVISPLIQEQLTQQFFEMKEKELEYIYNDLNAILNKISAKYFPCFSKFTENTNDYYIGEIDSNNTQLKYKYFSIYLNNWVFDPYSEIKEIERLYEKALEKDIVELIREMAHTRTRILVASQDPPSVNPRVIELSDIIILHQMSSPEWLKHIQGKNNALKKLTIDELSSLSKGEAYIWAKRSTDTEISIIPKKIQIRPRATEHGGVTKIAFQ